MRTCYIACALDCKIDINVLEDDLVIGADKGCEILIKNGYVPNVAIGDFDSIDGEVNCSNIIRHPVKKDDTDSVLAVEYAIKQGYDDIVIFGAIGGTLDHTIANISMLKRYTEKGKNIVLIDGDNVLFAVCNNEIVFDKKAEGRVSVFSATENSYGVSISGLLYELDKRDLSSSISLGVSNEFVGKQSSISVENGVLFLYTSKENYDKHLTKQ